MMMMTSRLIPEKGKMGKGAVKKLEEWEFLPLVEFFDTATSLVGRPFKGTHHTSWAVG